MYKQVFVAAALCFSVGVQAADSDNGSELYYDASFDATIQGELRAGMNCESCHNPESYTRADRKVNTLAGLEVMVERCNTNMDVGWFPEDVADVAAYLNESYYHLKR